MLKRILISLFVLTLAFSVAGDVFAQDLPYYFQVNKEDVHVYWNSDGSMSAGLYLGLHQPAQFARHRFRGCGYAQLRI